ncbi:hypothetical protein P6U16_01280 [Rhizobium sp. 32-5/1]|uniref:hypothetical protein n=1 Tax=Rhizobium sp. 32-5/1 TaxID=3019602 RepID=UPI00240D67DB|nr:hypothetical protein [Rhizobium sp. 32-5/1]WEZ83518.1 hypothetical protein P6U16_01280 [Rhizobium sp. 32-5/1]
MYRIVLGIFVWAISMVLSESILHAGDLADYKQLPTFRQASPHECDSDDVGSIQLSCRYIEIGSIDGFQLGNERKENDPRWKRLKKYELGGTRIKFGGIACGRGQTESGAFDMALGRAASATKEMIKDWEDQTFTEQLTGLGFNKYDSAYQCKRTPNTSSEDQLSTSSRPTETDGQLPETEDDARRAEELRIAEQQAQANEEARRSRATFIITNSDRYSLGLVFYSKSHGGEWPGNGKQYVLAGTETYNLKCSPGEKICFGAWRNDQTTIWGVGRKGKGGCQKCCIQCGQTLNTNLTDGGADSYPQTSSGGGQVLDDIIGAVGLGATIYNGLNGAGAFSDTPVSGPRGNPQRESGISGLD